VKSILFSGAANWTPNEVKYTLQSWYQIPR